MSYAGAERLAITIVAPARKRPDGSTTLTSMGTLDSGLGNANKYVEGILIRYGPTGKRLITTGAIVSGATWQHSAIWNTVDGNMVG